MVVDGGPLDSTGAPQGTINQAYVTVTLCVPGTATCQNIDHVWVDTGSFGLRVFASSFTAQLPTQTQSGNVVANCVQFVSNSYMWGAMRTADVKIAGLKAPSMPIQVVNDSAVTTTAPSACGGTAITTVGGLGANGLLGVGVFQQDCGSGCQNATTPPAPFYYTCPAGLCAPVFEATSLQNQNVAGLFPTDNNGVLIQMQSLASGSASTATGSLIFGIGTRTNNALGSAVVFAANPQSGNLQTRTTYGDLSEPASYVDSGTNFWQFNDSTITQCPSSGNDVGFYCPAPTVARSATMMPFNTTATAFTYSFNVADISNSSAVSGNAANNVGGPSVNCTPPSTLPCTFAWGLPFFYGRNVFFAIQSITNTPVNGTTVLPPFVAASTP
jgi:hypothetical protein